MGPFVDSKAALTPPFETIPAKQSNAKNSDQGTHDMSITHVVTFTFKPDTAAEALAKLSEAFEALAALIGGIESFRHGQDIGVRDDNADYAVAAVFTDEDAFAAYSTASEHLKLVSDFRPHLLSKSSVQF